MLNEFKKCSCCKSELPLSSFYKDASKPLGVGAQCKDCTKNRVAAYHKDNHGHRLAAASAYYAGNRERLLAEKKEYRLTEHGKLFNQLAVKRWTEKNPIKREAHKIVRLAVIQGTLIRGSCEICGCSTRVEAHHDDYAEPLSVRWLCVRHHKQWHTENGEGLNAQHLPINNTNKENSDEPSHC